LNVRIYVRFFVDAFLFILCKNEIYFLKFKNRFKNRNMSRNILTFLFFVMICLPCFSQVNSANFFEKGSIRYDVRFVGSADTFFLVHDQTKILPLWGGNFMVDDVDCGNYRYRVTDMKSGKLIFKKGLSPLFYEWFTTAEAKVKTTSSSYGFFFPKTVNDVLFSFDVRDSKNNWNEIYTDTISVSDFYIVNESPICYPIDTILFSGKSEDKIDIAILAEGYTLSEMDKFSKDARRMVDTLLNCQPFKEYSNRFNFIAVQVPSFESGSDVPGDKIYKNTALNSTYYTFNSPRYLTTSDMKSVYNAVDGVAWDHLIILVNSDIYGGGGFYNSMSICSADNARSAFVFCHEFGHAFAGLADEYYTSQVSYEEFYHSDVEPWEPNLTTLVNFDSKWKSMMDKSTPIPTPRDSLYAGKVGVFEGGGYVEKGVYSPTTTCWMKEMAAGKFCPVCQEAIKRTILRQSK
jgi:hypothetical protein